MNNKTKIISAVCTLAVATGLVTLTLTLRHHDEEVPVPPVQATTQPEPTTEEVTTLPLYDYVPSGNGMTERAKMLLKQNKDVVGWIKIEGTQVDYPFVRDPGAVPAGNTYYGGNAYEPNSYYLDHDLDGSYLRCGSLFCDYRDEFGSNEDQQSENIVIYGHNMANNTMFGSLRRYRQDYSFFEQAPFVELSSNYRDYDYVLCGFFITGGNWYSDFIYWDMEELDNEEDFNYYINNMHAKQLFDTGVDVKYGDKLLTLSTCYADEDNSRFIVVGRRLREGEVAGDMSTIQRTEEYIKAHEPTTEADATAEGTT
jgi:sortase B